MQKVLLKIKYLLSLLFYSCGICTVINYFIKLFYGNQPPLIVLCYHSVDEDMMCQFEKQIDYLIRQNYKIISGIELLKLLYYPVEPDNNSKYICLTFDDCYEDNYFIVRNILVKKKIPAIFFAPSYKLGQYVDWNSCYAHKRLMTVEQLKDMSRSFDIGSHTRNHIKLAEASSDVYVDEIKNSKNDLEKILDREVVFFAYPHGSYNRKVIQYLSECKFKSAFTVRQHVNYSYKEKYELGRYLIKPDNFRDFKLKVSGGYDWFFFLNKFLFHNICRIASFEKNKPQP